MRIRSKITSLVTALIALVVGSIVVNLIWLEQRRIRADASARIDALMEGVMRIGRESLNADDELMLLSYLKFLMQEYPEIEISVVSREGHTSVMGAVRSEFFYRTLTLTEGRAAAFEPAGKAVNPSRGPRRNPKQAALDKAAGAPSPARGAAALLPPGTFSIQLGFSKTALDRQIRRAQLALGIKILSIAFVGLVLGVGGSLWLGRLLARPISTLAGAAESIGEGRLDTQVRVEGKDEIADLGRKFNEMASKINELVRFKEDLMSTLSHEMRTPLAGLKGFLEFLQTSRTEQSALERKDAYETMFEAVSQMELSLTNALQLFKTGARPELHREELSMTDVVSEVIRLFTPTAQSNGVKLRGPAGAAPILIRADRELIRRVVINLVSNAVLYTPSGGTVTVSVSEDDGSASISVADTGPGIAPEDRQRIFEKFYRAPGPDGRPQRIPGSGLGLAIAKQAVDMHQGRISVDSEVGRGSVFNVTLPKSGGGK